MRFEISSLYWFLFLICSVPVLADSARETSMWSKASETDMTHYFRGKIGDRLPIQMAISIPGDQLIDTDADDDAAEDDTQVGGISGYYFYERHGRPIHLQGNHDIEDVSEFYHIRLSESGDGEENTGHFDLKWRDLAGVKVRGEWTSADKRKRFPVELELVAVQRRLEAGSTRCSVDVCSPYFLRKGEVYAAANQQVRNWRNEQFLEYQDADAELWEEATSTPGDDGPSYYGMAHEYSKYITPIHCADDVVSLASFDWSFTGGAHGNTWFDNFNIARDRDGAVRAILLEDLFTNPVQGLKIVAGKVVEELREQGAIWGIAKEGSKADVANELSIFILTPEGIAFAFAPYEVHGYAAGSFSVTVGWDEIAGIVDSGRWPFLERWVSPGLRSPKQANARQ